MSAVSYLTNPNVLAVVRGYLDAMNVTSFDEQVALIQKVIKDSGLRKTDISRLTGIPVTRLYEYARPDWVERHRVTYKHPSARNVMFNDFVRLLSLGDSLSQ